MPPKLRPRRRKKDVIVIEDSEEDGEVESSGEEEEEALEAKNTVCNEKVLLKNPLNWRDEGFAFPQVLVEDFRIVDQNGEMKSFEEIEDGASLYLEGDVIPPDATSTRKVAVRTGVLTEWWLGSYGNGDQVTFGVSTDQADYTLGEAAASYAAFPRSVMDKAWLSKMLIEFLESQPDECYEEMLSAMEERSAQCGRQFSEDSLHKHAEWLCEQVVSYCEWGDVDDDNLIRCEALQMLIRVCGVTPRSLSRKNKNAKKPKLRVTKERMIATTTKVVRKVFSVDFKELFGQDIDKDLLSEEESFEAPATKRVKSNPQGHLDYGNDVVWGEVQKDEQHRTLYIEAFIASMHIVVGDYVMMEADDTANKPLIGKLISLYETADSVIPMCHIHWLVHGCDTYLGEAAKPNELFFSYEDCQDVDLYSFMRKISVHEKSQGTIYKNHVYKECVDLYCVEYVYDDETGAFTTPKLQYYNNKKPSCYSCSIKKQKRRKEKAVVRRNGSVIDYWGSTYSVGSFVYVEQRTEDDDVSVVMQENKTIDEKRYPEKWRRKDYDRFPDVHPFTIGKILKITNETSSTDARQIELTLQKIYRPSETIIGDDGWKDPVKLVYPSDEIFEARLDTLWGVCRVIKNASPSQLQAPHCFYYVQSYLTQRKKFTNKEIHLKMYTTESLNRENAEHLEAPRKRMRNRCGHEIVLSSDDENQDLPKRSSFLWSSSNVKLQKLQALDLFSGCGGLTLGLAQSGLSEAAWAVEVDPSIADSFRVNFPRAKLFVSDVNLMLKEILEGKSTDSNHVPYPKQGEVQMITAGPPCQGFSLLNKFSKSEVYLFKNSLIVTALSFCEYYKPRFFLLENVSAFASHKQGNVLKLVVRCLLELGYQCRFAYLQAGCYGAPQHRRRFILLAAQRNEVLAKFPEPSHVFPAGFSAVKINKHKLKPGLELEKKGHLRPTTIRDLIHDLPSASESFQKEPCRTKDCQAFFPWSCTNAVICDHIIRPIDPLNAARFSHIPHVKGADWRDLPNIQVTLSDGSMTEKLHYPYGSSEGDGRKGVCSCFIGRRCAGAETRQANTLIPWWLPHTADNNGQWKGVYGRLSEHGYFQTIVTNPMPGMKQGRILHPHENRIMSVRECARGQGFPDSFCFEGSIEVKYKIIGNAVPPPIAKALGEAIIQQSLQTEISCPGSSNCPIVC